MLGLVPSARAAQAGSHLPWSRGLPGPGPFEKPPEIPCFTVPAAQGHSKSRGQPHLRRRGVHRSWGIWGARCSRPGPTTLIRGLWPTGHLPPHSQKNPLNRSVRYKQLVIF